MAGPVTRFLGGSPLGVFVRLALISAVVGFIMHWFGITPGNVIAWTVDMAIYAYDSGFALLGEVFGYVLVGAVVVVPLFLLSRLLKSGRGSPQ